MKGTDRTILIVLPLIALAIGFYLLVLSPKQREAGELQDKVDTLSSKVEASEAQISAAEDARSAFSKNYTDLVELGTAVPEDDDQATLIHDLNTIGLDNDLTFQSFKVAEAPDGATAPAPAEASTSTDSSSSTDGGTAASDSGSTTSATSTTGATATEATAATLPIGATVGVAGLPITPYTLTYYGGFFDMAGLFNDLDSRVTVSDGGSKPVSHGRLMTIDGFALTADPIKGFPRVAAEVAVTTYMVPDDQGTAAGATPAGPAPPGSPDAPVPVSSSTASSPAATATVTP